MQTQTYTTKHSAQRGAKRAGLEQFEVKQNEAGQFYFVDTATKELYHKEPHREGSLCVRIWQVARFINIGKEQYLKPAEALPLIAEQVPDASPATIRTQYHAFRHWNKK